MTRDQKIQEKIAKESGISTNQVVLANRSMFEFIKKEIESGNRRPIRIPKWGLFSCKRDRVKSLAEKGLLDTKKPTKDDKIYTDKR